MSQALVYPCPHCLTPNRLPENPMSMLICGKCKQTMFSDQVFSTTDADFDAQVLQAPLPVLVDFWAPWCAPCRSIAPILVQLAEAHAARLLVMKVNVDENPQLANRYQVRSIPTMMIFHQGQLLDTLQGVLPLPILQKRVAQYLR